jgi:hypothetical protein
MCIIFWDNDGVYFGIYSYQHFGRTHCLHLHLLPIYQSIRRHIAEDCNLGAGWRSSFVDSYLDGTGLESRPGHRLSSLGVFLTLLSPLRKFRECTSIRPLAYKFVQFIIIYHTLFDAVKYSQCARR